MPRSSIAATPIRSTSGTLLVPTASTSTASTPRCSRSTARSPEKKRSELDDEPVRSELEAGRRVELRRAVRDEEALGAGGLERGLRLVEGEVAADFLVVVISRGKGRLAHEEVGVRGHFDQVRTRPRVARVGERRLPVADSEPVRLGAVVLHPRPDDSLAGGLERNAGLVLVQEERILEHPDEPELGADPPKPLPASRRHPEVRAVNGFTAAAAEIERSPDPGDQ